MDKENNFPPLFDDNDMQAFEDTIAFYNDLARTNINLIPKIQKQLKRNNALASVIILCIIAFGFYLLCMLLSHTTNSIIMFELRKECRSQELIEYSKHIERSLDIIHMDQKHSLNYMKGLGKLTFLRIHIVQQLKDKLLNFFILLDIMSIIEVFHFFFFIGLEKQFLVTFTTY